MSAPQQPEPAPAGPEAGNPVSKPIVWAWCVGEAFGDQAWVAIADDGRGLAQHVSSSEWWGQRDVGPDGFAGRRQHYIDVLGTADVDYRVLPLGERPPAEVMQRHHAFIESEAAAAAANAHVRGEPDPTVED